MEIKNIFNKDYISFEDYKKIFQEIYDEFGKDNVSLRISNSVVYRKDDDSLQYVIDGDSLASTKSRIDILKDYLEKKKHYSFYKRTIIKVIVKLVNGKSVRLDTFKEESMAKVECVNLMEICIGRITHLMNDLYSKGVSVYQDGNCIEFSTIRTVEFTKEETTDLMKFICHE